MIFDFDDGLFPRLFGPDGWSLSSSASLLTIVLFCVPPSPPPGRTPSFYISPLTYRVVSRIALSRFTFCFEPALEYSLSSPLDPRFPPSSILLSNPEFSPQPELALGLWIKVMSRNLPSLP